MHNSAQPPPLCCLGLNSSCFRSCYCDVACVRLRLLLRFHSYLCHRWVTCAENNVSCFQGCFCNQNCAVHEDCCPDYNGTCLRRSPLFSLTPRLTSLRLIIRPLRKFNRLTYHMIHNI
ncbi:mucin-5AC-like [Arapaima gigas]